MAKVYDTPDVVQLLGIAEISGDGNGDWIDTRPYEGVLGFVLSAKATSGSDPTLDVKLEHAEQDDKSDVDDVPDGAFTQVTDEGEGAEVTQVLRVQKNALRRWVRPVKNIGGSSTPKFLASGLVLAHKKHNV